MKDSASEFRFETLNIFEYVFDKRKPLIVIAVVAILASGIISFLLPVKYKSTVVLFPASSESVSQALFSKTTTSKDLLKFGEEEEVEQFLQVLYSDQIRERITQKYNLYEHYSIDKNGSYPKTQMKRQYEENVSFRRTEFLSIEIEVLDEDPQMAADIANDIANLADSTMIRMHRERAEKALLLVKNEYNSVLENIKNLQDSVNVIRSLGIYDFESQSEVYNDAYATALAEGRKEGAKALEEKLAILAKYGSRYTELRDQLIYETERLGLLRIKYMEAKVDAKQELPSKFVVSWAEKAERKSYPIRWLIVFTSTLAALVFSVIVLLLIDFLKKKTSTLT